MMCTTSPKWVPQILILSPTTRHQLPELSDKKMDATNALFEPPLKHAKMIILLVKIRLFSFDVGTRILPLKFKHYSAGIGSGSEVDL